jgi:GMP synthase (glutamine-hydrolysing)
VKRLTVIQHTSSDYLGFLEDHFERCNIGFRYVRPFTEGVGVPRIGEIGDGLVLLGGGPWGAAGGRDVPTLREEIALARYCLLKGLPLIGVGLGAQILSIAGEGRALPQPLTFAIGEARCCDPAAFGGLLPERIPQVVYMRDWPEPPAYVRVLAKDEKDRPAIFQLGERAFGFVAHPGFKAAMAEDLIMEFEEAPLEPSAALERLRGMRRDIEGALAPIAAGLVAALGLMEG